ncbi:MAG TPA: SMI1/KNR4 family protein [Acidimicrobiales bacterium]|nr:SMI1/KNR4 family protein [Acidimicrobiales bacterium]
MQAGHSLPVDLAEFYERCGGADLFAGELFPVHISSPDEFVLVNPLIIGGLAGDDITDDWYVVASGGDGERISIDLHPDRLGTCYDSFLEVHGVRGSCAIVARSFSELLEHLLDGRGGHWYWLEPGFEPLGDAYDSSP